MRLIGIQNDVSSFGKRHNCGNDCRPRPKKDSFCCEVIVVEDPSLKRALRTASRIIAADLYMQSNKNK